MAGTVVPRGSFYIGESSGPPHLNFPGSPAAQSGGTGRGKSREGPKKGREHQERLDISELMKFRSSIKEEAFDSPFHQSILDKLDEILGAAFGVKRSDVPSAESQDAESTAGKVPFWKRILGQAMAEDERSQYRSRLGAR